jgi:adenylosuccinate synthase
MTRSVAVVGLGFGDEGKGSIVDALTRHLRARAVVRFNGGPQAAHHVVYENGYTHCFAQLGSGLLAGHLAGGAEAGGAEAGGAEAGAARGEPARGEVASASGPAVLVDLLTLGREAAVVAAETGLAAPLGRLHLDARSLLVTPFHRAMNRLTEALRGDGRHGSCGLGVGQTFLDGRNPQMPSLRVGDLSDPGQLRRRLGLQRLMKLDQAEQLARGRESEPAVAAALATLTSPAAVAETIEGWRAVASELGSIDEGAWLAGAASAPRVFEGAQGTLLDADRGFFPFVTPSTTTFAGALALAPGAFRLGLLRAYSTRHGAGPFVAHDPALDALLPEAHNLPNPWQGPMRAGWFDLVAARHALALAGGVDALALTCLDRLSGLGEVGLIDAWAFDGPASDLDLFDLDPSAKSPLIKGIIVPPVATREHQLRLTAALAHCRPVVRLVRGWRAEGDAAARAFVAEVGAALGVQVAVESWGATAAGKRFAGALG